MTWWSMMFVAAIVSVMVIVGWWGATQFSETRARNVKYAERVYHIVPDRTEIALKHPEIVRFNRLDRHFWFLVPHVCVLGYTICVFAGAKLTSNVTALGYTPRYTMAACFLVGSILVLFGALMGRRVGRWTIMGDVSDHLTAEILGDNIVLPYRLEMAGMSAMIVSAGIYATTSFGSTTGSLGGWLTGGIVVLCVLSIPQFFLEVAKFQKWNDIIISEAKVRAGICDAD